MASTSLVLRPLFVYLGSECAATQVWTKMILWCFSGGSIGSMSKQMTMGCGCPVMAFQKMISGKYKVRILWDLKDGALRYSAIRSGLLRGGDSSQEIAPRVLSRELKALVETGLLSRKDYGVVPPKVE